MKRTLLGLFLIFLFVFTAGCSLSNSDINIVKKHSFSKDGLTIEEKINSEAGATGKVEWKCFKPIGYESDVDVVAIEADVTKTDRDKTRRIIKMQFLLNRKNKIIEHIYTGEKAFPYFPDSFASNNYLKDTINAINKSDQKEIIKETDILVKETDVQLYTLIINTSGNKTPYEYAINYLKSENMIIVLLAMEEKRIEIAVGSNLQDILSDEYCGKILDELAVPKFKRAKFSGGIKDIVLAICNKVLSDYKNIPLQKSI